jgi:hypothetical protein
MAILSFLLLSLWFPMVFRPHYFYTRYSLFPLFSGPMVNPAASNYQGEQFLVDLDDQARAAKRQEQLDPRGAMAAAGGRGGGGANGSPTRQSYGAANFGSPGGGGYGSGRAPPPYAQTGAGAGLPEDEKMHILQRTHHKSTRLNGLQEVLQNIEDDDLPKVRGGAARCTRSYG